MTRRCGWPWELSLYLRGRRLPPAVCERQAPGATELAVARPVPGKRATDSCPAEGQARPALPSPPEPRRSHRRRPQLGQRVAETADGDGEALHLQAGDVVADQVAGNPGAVAGDVPADLVVEAVQLDQRRAAHAVDHDEPVAFQ